MCPTRTGYSYTIHRLHTISNQTIYDIQYTFVSWASFSSYLGIPAVPVAAEAAHHDIFVGEKAAETVSCHLPARSAAGWFGCCYRRGPSASGVL